MGLNQKIQNWKHKSLTMEITAYTWYFLITATIVCVALIISNIIFLRHYLKLKTPGSILLLLTYFLFTIGEILNTTGLWYYTFVSETSPISGYFELNFAFFYAVGYIFFYFFANRHILEDNDLVKSLTAIILTIIISVTSSLMYVELVYQNVDPIFYNEIIVIGPNLKQYLPTMLAGLMIFIPIFLFIHLRIIIGITKLRRSIEDSVSKTGFTFILFTIISFVLSALIASTFIMPNVGNYPRLYTTLHSLRILTIIIAVLLGYFGWTLPNWLKKRLQKRDAKKLEQNNVS
ncbi:MAG: hypothetical protein GNW80_10650 [Asgard group archaeon]|nr:hypothetical protein [Asgard group archaeon]